MWYEIDGERIGVLNDYDLSSLADEPGPRGNERTGTVPFMALDLLTEEGQRGEVEHLYRHDLESFMWCFAWISLRYKKGVLLPWGLRPLDEWATVDAVTCCKEKGHFQSRGKRPATLKDDATWMLIQTCMDVLTQRELQSRRRLRSANALTNSQQPESESDMDDFLAEFTGSEAWAELSRPAPSQ
jgi:transcriptional regulator of met regulon